MYAPIAQLAMNNKVSERHNSRSFALMFARNLNEFRDYCNEKPKRPLSVEENQKAIKNMEEIVFPAINERTKNVNDTCKEKYDAKKNLVEYKPGTQVIIKVREKLSKLDAEWEGPYTIVRKTQGNSYVLRDLQKDLERRYYTPAGLKPALQTQKAEKIYTVDRIVAHKK